VTTSIDPWKLAFPLYATEWVTAEQRRARTLAPAGTAFLAAPTVLVSCWHCVRPLPDNAPYVVIVRENDRPRFLELSRVSRANGGLDLAIGRVDLPLQHPIRPHKGLALLGSDVCAIGFPLTEVGPTPEGNPTWYPKPWLVHGYVVRVHDGGVGDPTGRHLRYDVDMPLPNGMSGAPVFTWPLGDVPALVGVAYGQRTYTPADLASDGLSAAGVTFAQVHDLTSVLQLQGSATDERPLGDIMLKHEGG
jgi:Trypsin-like peptidase domain